jgi:hypothetical protein
MRILLAALMPGALALLAACDNSAPVGSRAALLPPAMGSDYHRQIRAADDRRGLPYSIPPEVPGAPPAAPMATPPLPPAAPARVPPLAAASPQVAAVPQVAARPAGVADNTTYTPIPFGQRPAGAEIPPSGSTELVTVTSVPTGPAGAPNVLAYALQTTHAVGTVQHSRRNPFRWLRWERVCRGFVSQDAAQEAFLAAGGPERDPHNLDPDGDGFACWWDPELYRQAARLGQ